MRWFTLVTLALSAPLAAQPGFPQHLSLSPDGETLVFSASGDLWAVPSSGGVASRLTSHPALETRSAFSPDASMLAFESDRHGSRNLYVVPVSGDPLVAGAPRRVTTSDRSQTLASFSADGTALIYSARQEPAIYREDRMYRAPLDAGPVERITDAFGSEPSQSPDGLSIYFTRGNNPDFRPRYRGPGARDIWRYLPGTDTFERFDGLMTNGFGNWLQGMAFGKVYRNANLNTHRIQTNVSPREGMNLTVEWHRLRADELNNLGANPALSQLTSRDIGDEYTATLRWGIDRNRFLQGVASRALPGGALRDIGADEPWSTLQASLYVSF